AAGAWLVSGFVVAGLCIAGCAVIFGGFELFVGSGRAKLHDLTRPADYLCQVTRKPRNDLAAEAYQRRLAASGHAPVRRARVRPEPEQVMAWEDDGGTPA